VTHTGLPSVCLTSAATNPIGEATVYLGIKAPYNTIPLKDYLGKRIRFSAWVKSDNLINWGGMFLVAASRTPNRSEALDFMADRPLSGTADWRKAEIVVEITPDTTDM